MNNHMEKKLFNYMIPNTKSVTLAPY